MKSILQFFVLLAVPSCLAKIAVQPLGSVVRCPSSKEEVLQRVTLGGFEDHAETDEMATVACIKEVGEEYEEALELFVTNMTELTSKFSDMYGENVQNYPYFASKALKDMGVKILAQVKLLKSASDKAQLGKVKVYEENIKKHVDEDYGLYERNIKHLEDKAKDKETDAKNMIHLKCKPGMGKLEEVEKKFKECMDGRYKLNESETKT